MPLSTAHTVESGTLMTRGTVSVGSGTPTQRTAANTVARNSTCSFQELLIEDGTMTAKATVGQKADHVRSAAQTRRHTCHWPDCEKQVPPAMWGCKQHWFMLPRALRNKVWRAYRPGQEDSMDPSQDYLEVAREVQQWIAENGR